MPFYEYQCQACGAQTEELQKITDAPLRKCRNCGKLKLVRLVSAPVFRLKGGGWYETDFKSEGEKKHNLAGGEDRPAADPKPVETTAAAADKPSTADKPSAGGKPETSGKVAEKKPGKTAAAPASTGARARKPPAAAKKR